MYFYQCKSVRDLLGQCQDLVRSGRLVASQQFDRTPLYVEVSDKSES